MPDATWYESMASAMKARERCLTAITKWQGLLAEAEAEIQALRDGDAAATDVASDPGKFQDISFPVGFKAAEPQLAGE